MTQNRREFLTSSAAGMVMGLSVWQQPGKRILIRSRASEGALRLLAERELLRGLVRLFPNTEVTAADEATSVARLGDFVFALAVDAGRFQDSEAYEIAASNNAVTLTGASEQALLYAVFQFLEEQGVFFGIDGESYPLGPPRDLRLPANQPWTAKPRFAVRGLLPWPDFLNCISVYNEEDFRAYFEAMLRMRFNTFGMHVYTGANQWAESYLSFEFAGAGHLAFLDNSASHRWGYLPQKTSTFTMSGADFYDSEVFGSDATRLARDPWENAERARRLLRDAFAYARRLGIRTGVGFEPYQIPDEIFRALPPEVRPSKKAGGARFDIESNTARDLLEARLGQLLEAYPDVDYVWLWEDEDMNWESRRTGIPLSVTPFLQAHDFLRRQAPKKRLVVAGWGGVARHFDDFHQRLPGDIVFTCLSDSLGWDPVDEVFGRLGQRERWPVLWLEDDPAMWLPQFHVHRFESDINRAEKMGCQGLIGIHWRHRIVDPTAGFQARYCWDAALKPATYYQAYAATQATGTRAQKLASILTEADRDRLLLCTFTGEVKDGHAVTHEYSGDYNEGFTFWNDYEPPASVLASQEQVGTALRELTAAAGSAAEREKLDYLTHFVEFLAPYAESWRLAHRLNRVLKEAGELKAQSQSEKARSKVLEEGVPLWLQLAPEVRSAMLHVQRAAATRNDLGQIASMHNKYVRLALFRLRLSLKEYLGVLPAEVDQLLRQVTQPDSLAQPRLIVPTRPTMLGPGETARVKVVVSGPRPPVRVTLHVRTDLHQDWTPSPAEHVARRTYLALLGPLPGGAKLAHYYVSASLKDVAAGLFSPVDAPAGVYSITAL